MIIGRVLRMLAAFAIIEVLDAQGPGEGVFTGWGPGLRLFAQAGR